MDPQTLITLTKGGTLSELEEFLSQHAASNSTSSSSESISHLINDVIVEDLTPLGHAVYRRDIDIVQLLLQYGADATSTKNWDLLHTALEFKDLDIVQCLAKAGMRVNTVDPYSMYHTPLTRAVRSRNLKAMKILFANGAEVNLRGYRRSAPIHIACSIAWLEGLQLLLSSGADPFIAYDFNCKPIYAMGKIPHSDQEGSWSCMELLLSAMQEKGLSQEQWCQCLQSSLIPAVKNNDTKLLKHLLSAEAVQCDSANFLTNQSRLQILDSLLAETAGFCSLDIATFFLESGASPNSGFKEVVAAADSNPTCRVVRMNAVSGTSSHGYTGYMFTLGRSAAFQAASNGRSDTLKLLIQHGAYLTCESELTQSCQWSSLLSEAVRHKHERSAVLLLLGNCKPMIPRQEVYSACYHNLLNFLEMYILVGAQTYPVEKWLVGYMAMLRAFPSQQAVDTKVTRLKGAISTSRLLTHQCRRAVRGVLRQGHRQLAESVSLLDLPKVLHNFLLLKPEEESLVWT